MLEEYEKNLNKTTYDKVKSYMWGATFTYALTKIIEGIAWVVFYPIVFLVMGAAKLFHDKAPKSKIEKEVRKEERLLLREEKENNLDRKRFEKEYKKQYIEYKRGKKNAIINTTFTQE